MLFLRHHFLGEQFIRAGQLLFCEIQIAVAFADLSSGRLGVGFGLFDARLGTAELGLGLYDSGLGTA